MAFNGSAAAETFDVSRNGDRVRYFRNVGNITMDLDGVERIDTAALGGADAFTQGDLGGTDVSAQNVDLAGPGGTAGDGAADTVTAAGSAGNDAVTVAGDAANGVTVSGLSAVLTITHPEGTADALTIAPFSGGDTLDTNGLAAGTLLSVLTAP
jgi:hypothetical protein